jgi:hypothetical protein
MSLSARIAYGPSYFSPLLWENEDDVRGQDRIHTDCGEPSVLIAARRDLAMRLYDEDGTVVVLSTGEVLNGDLVYGQRTYPDLTFMEREAIAAENTALLRNAQPYVAPLFLMYPEPAAHAVMASMYRDMRKVFYA